MLIGFPASQGIPDPHRPWAQSPRRGAVFSQMLWGTLPMGWVLGGSWVLWSALPDWFHSTGCWGLNPALAGWCGAQPHSDESGVWGSAPQCMDAVGPQAQPQQVLLGGLAFPGLPWIFQPLGCSNHSLKPNYIFSLADALSLRGPCPSLAAPLCPCMGEVSPQPLLGHPPHGKH